MISYITVCLKYSGGGQDSCDTYDLSDNAKGGLGASAAFTAIAAALLLFGIVVMFVQSCKEKHGKNLKFIVLVAGICGLIAIICGTAGAGDCFGGDADLGMGASTIINIVAAVLCFAAVFCIHSDTDMTGS